MCREIKAAIEIDELVRVGTGRARVDVVDQLGRSRRDVIIPELGPVGAVIRREKKRAAHGRDRTRGRGAGAGVAVPGAANRADPQILDEHGPLAGAARRPELVQPVGCRRP